MVAVDLKAIVFGTGDSIAGTVYGTIVVMGAITAGSASETNASHIAEIVAATVIVLWIAHVYSDGLAESVALGRRLDRAEFVSVARRELSIALAAVGPVAVLVLGALGVLRESRAIWLALAIGVATLAVQGVRYARLEHVGRGGTFVVVLVNVLLGLAIVLLKALVAH
jgi:hypothetical protein